MENRNIDFQNEMNGTLDNEAKDDRQETEVHFIEDLEKRRNASGFLTTMAVGEEGGGGWW